MALTFLVEKVHSREIQKVSALRFGIVVPWENVQTFGLAIFDIYLGSRIMRLTMLEIGKNHQSYNISACYFQSIFI